MMDGLDSTVFKREGVFLICTSTYGQGDVPDNARALYEHLQSAKTGPVAGALRCIRSGRPHLRGNLQLRRQALRQILTSLGAKRIGERHMHDASSGILPEETALEWCQAWLAKVREEQTA